jgi:hypothetical protein
MPEEGIHVEFFLRSDSRPGKSHIGRAVSAREFSEEGAVAFYGILTSL